VPVELTYDRSLGTTRITGTVRNASEADMGYALAIRGLLGSKAQQNAIHFVDGQAVGAAEGQASWLASPEAVGGQPALLRSPVRDPEQMSAHIKKVAASLRADAVGIGRMPPYAYYSHKVLDFTNLRTKPAELCVEPVTERYPYVIVLMVDQPLASMLRFAGYDALSTAQSRHSNYVSASMSVMLAQYIRSLGYHARAHHAANYAAVMVPCVIAAGLGEFSRMGGSAIHPRLGFRPKVAAVTTDLPLMPDPPLDFGLQDFCRKCRKCAEHCPSGAISLDRDPVEFNGYLRWNWDIKKCTRFRTTNRKGTSCARCMNVCPWNHK